MKYLSHHHNQVPAINWFLDRSKGLLAIMIMFLVCTPSQAQLMDELKKRAKEKGLETKEVSFDSTENAKNRTTSFEEEEKVIHTAKDFFNTDLVMELFHEDDAVIHTQYFDSDAVAMRTEFPDRTKKPMYHDAKGYIYGYNEDTAGYEKMKLMSTGMMGFMMAGMIPQAYKLPAEPYIKAFQALEEKEIALNFLILELAFIYKPSDFEGDSNYTQKKTSCNHSDKCIKFQYNDPEYPGSYIQFDEQGRLVELYINTINPEVEKENHPTGRFVYIYKDCSVKLPEAEEQSMVPGELGKMLNLERGLEPWKHNKKDKKKKNNN